MDRLAVPKESKGALKCNPLEFIQGVSPLRIASSVIAVKCTSCSWLRYHQEPPRGIRGASCRVSRVACRVPRLGSHHHHHHHHQCRVVLSVLLRGHTLQTARVKFPTRPDPTRPDLTRPDRLELG